MSTFVHMELHTSDVEGAKQFYAGLFGWRFPEEKMADGTGYTMIAAADGAGIGGILKNPMEGPSHWLGYVGVESVAATAAQVEGLGGTVAVPATEVPGMGKFAVLIDPQGTVFAVWESVSPEVSAEPKKTKADSKAAASKAGSKKGAKQAESKPAKQGSKAAASKPGAKKAAASKPGAKQAAASKPSAKQAAASKPGAKQAAASKPGAKQAAASKPGAKQAAAGKPAATKPSSKKTAAKKAAAGKRPRK